jgi:dTDP-glucose 4,6-dehydratase
MAKIWKIIWRASVFYHISTDEVYGSLGAEGLFTSLPLTTLIRLILPQKQVQGIILLEHTWRNVWFTLCTNKLFQLIGLFTFQRNWFRYLLIILYKTFTCLWNGKYTRDWLFWDHAVAIDWVFTKGKPCISNIGGFNEWQNIDLGYLVVWMELNLEDGGSSGRRVVGWWLWNKRLEKTCQLVFR